MRKQSFLIANVEKVLIVWIEVQTSHKPATLGFNPKPNPEQGLNSQFYDS